MPLDVSQYRRIDIGRVCKPAYSQEHQLLYASNPKSGSTSMKKWFLRLGGSTIDFVDMHGVHNGISTKYTPFRSLVDSSPADT